MSFEDLSNSKTLFTAPQGLTCVSFVANLDTCGQPLKCSLFLPQTKEVTAGWLFIFSTDCNQPELSCSSHFEKHWDRFRKQNNF